ncbi:MAG: AAA family ATPase [Flavobacteriaceae bacterium]|nr:AAA family ATPase [Flavobacteriaceae bacterium]
MNPDIKAITEKVEKEATFVENILKEVSKVIVGQDYMIERLLIGLLSNGHILLEGVPGLAKTLTVNTLSKAIKTKFQRIQFTPDLLPADLIGTLIYNQKDGAFTTKKGPIFSNLVLADEINRSPAKVQSALLEAMEERQVSVAGSTYKMEPLFMVMATQNPVEQEGTYPLPEAQMDRFLMHVTIDYPDDNSELKIMRLNRAEQKSVKKSEKKEKLSPQVVFDARKEIEGITITENMEKYIVDIVSASRYPEKYSEQLANWIEYGASPRGTIAIDRSARTHAWMNGNEFVTPDDVRAVVHDCLRHRLILSYEANAEGVTADKVIDELLKLVAVVG